MKKTVVLRYHGFLSLLKSIFRQTVRLSRMVQDGIFFFQGSRKNKIFVGSGGAVKRVTFLLLGEKEQAQLCDGARRTVVLREVKKMTNRCKSGENSMFSPLLFW